ncbi:hypothetical protein HG535_0E04890 [Zygotorulaspora mrakii]|uniref:GH16 domain-containing protein n=1 Tax=Zygotorulaspora mrakii TaxID=42260 RepID=A0A7H9B423_ZYGMR|nr:uncharacterized protein HG535_0E04890 [Zygotorulaspora mrakii]QLG73405.1 hypothetical protein HG535_0E04890 [Zygotorulaspora mrakii]
MFSMILDLKCLMRIFRLAVCLVLLLENEFSFFVRGELYKPEQPITCSDLKQCPKEWPCCSPYGQCGAGPICIGSCNPRFSFEKHSCAPLPALVPNSIIQFLPKPIQVPAVSLLEVELLERGIIDFTKYLITPDVAAARQMLNNVEFTFSGPLKLDEQTGDLLLTMPKHSTGTLIASTKSFLYGASFVRLKSGRSRGVITSVVLISSVGDEIDFEFLGSELNSVQTNYFYRGALVYTHMEHVNITSSTHSEYHDYGFDWDEDRIHWLVDGVIVRTLFREDTWDETTQSFKYPETPMRLEVGLWPGGAANNHPGTIEWAGGTIDWDNAIDIVENGQFTAHISYMIAEPYVNEHPPEISTCIEQGKVITFDYFSFDDMSLQWYCDLVPNIPGWQSSGSDIGRIPKPMIRKVDMHHEQTILVNPGTDFIQDTHNLDISEDGLARFNKSRNASIVQPEESSAKISCLHNNPLYILKMSIILYLSKFVSTM